MRLKKTKLASIVSIIILMVSIIGCATMLLPAEDSIKIECSKPGVSIFIDGEYAGSAPCVVKVSRREDHIIRVEAEGYMTQEVTLERGFNAWGVADIVSMGLAAATVAGTAAYDYYYLLYTGGPAALMLTMSIVDLANGRAFDFPETVQIVLQ